MKISIKNKFIFLIICVAVFFGIWTVKTLAQTLECNFIDMAGYAWSDQIGWIKFKSASGAAVGYGVYETVYDDPPTCTSQSFQGYAWSENIGWITFNEAELVECPSAPCSTYRENFTTTIKGWARACYVFQSGCSGTLNPNRGNNDGWISLSGANYGITRPGNFAGWAWSNDFGWISFNCSNTGACPASTYYVSTLGEFNSNLVPVCDSLEAFPSSGQAPFTLSFLGQGHDQDATGTISSYEVDFTAYEAGCGTEDQPNVFCGGFTRQTSCQACGCSWNKSLGRCVNPVIGVPLCSSFLTEASCTACFCEWGGSETVVGQVTSTESIFQYTFNNSGNYCGSLYVKDNEGALSYSPGACTAACAKTITVTNGTGNNLPTCSSLTANPLTGIAPLNVSFSAAAADSDGIITEFLFDFGDGSFSTSTVGSLGHQYTESGTFCVKVRAKDEDGAWSTIPTTCSESCSKTITVSEPVGNNPPVISSGPSFTTIPVGGGVAGFDYCTGPTTQSGCNVYFSVSATDPDGDTLDYWWNFGDGIGMSGQQNASYNYTIPSTPVYNVTVTVYDGRGGQDQESFEIAVQDPTLAVDLCAGLDAGNSCSFGSVLLPIPANGVDLKSVVTGSMFGDINYKFDCNNDGTWEHEINSQRVLEYTKVNACNYLSGSPVAKTRVERGPSFRDDIVEIDLNYPPVLNWTGEEGYVSDGLNPDVGNAAETFTYRIKYSSEENNAPQFVRVHIKKGGVEISGSPFSMSFVSGNYIEGAIYSYPKTGFDYSTDYSYYFETKDSNGLVAIYPASEINKPDIGHSPVVLMSCLGSEGESCDYPDDCSDPWYIYNSCVFAVENNSTDQDNDIVTSTWGIYYEGGESYAGSSLICPSASPPPEPPETILCDYNIPSSVVPESQNYYVQLVVTDSLGLASTATHAFYVRKDAEADFMCSLDEEAWQNCEDVVADAGERVYLRDNLADPNRNSSASEGASITNHDWTINGDHYSQLSLYFDLAEGSNSISLKITDSVNRIDTSATYIIEATGSDSSVNPEWQETKPK